MTLLWIIVGIVVVCLIVWFLTAGKKGGGPKMPKGPEGPSGPTGPTPPPPPPPETPGM